MDEVTDRKRVSRYKAYLKGELEAAAMYTAMARADSDPDRAAVFEDLVGAEMRHASRWAEKLGMDSAHLEPAHRALRVRMYGLAARVFGTSRVIPWLERGEVRDIGEYASDPEARDFVRDERNHARVLRALAQGKDSIEAVRSHGSRILGSGGSLRAAVLGVNDGLVSNFSLVMGVAAGASQADLGAEFVLLAGVAGLLAGAFSMAAGEYVSMRSQRDIYEYQLRVEEAELAEWPEEEEQQLAMIYQAKGVSEEDSRQVARQIMADPKIALDTMAREELGLDPGQLGSPWGASFSSFVAFGAGAIVPILPYLLNAGESAFILSGVLSALALLAVGGSLSSISGRSVLWGALRMGLAGGAAAAVTFGIGHLVGVSLAG